jgi:phosphatidylserine/phosphatidylglycerophosphate/cardiolipin synthase-like enzyme
VTNRDTSVVVRELFAGAKEKVLIAGYAVYQGQRVFAALAERMDECPALRVRIFLDIRRPHGDTSTTSALVRQFADRFVKSQWPAGGRLPETLYYPASLELDSVKRSSLHAKCVVIDGEAAFVSSANFTEAAHERNVEVGVLIRSPLLAQRITRHFDAMLEENLMTPLIFPS